VSKIRIHHRIEEEKHPLILIVEDNQKILYNLKLLLEFNSYHPLTATNGFEALETLKRLENPPDLILCDIMMPKMDGYEFYQKITENSRWSLIPFIFLTAKASPEDVRLGKMLGADDYITKPFNDEDLLSSVAGKLNRSKKAKLLSKQIEKELLASLRIDQAPSISESERKSIFVFLMVWDEIYGPKLETVYPLDNAPPYDIRLIGTQLFQTKVSLYGHKEYYEAQGVLLKISNYLESIRIRDILQELARKIKEGINWEMSFYWNQVSKILISPTVDLT
jgi:CheY-like chemotaxis protein